MFSVNQSIFGVLKHRKPLVINPVLEPSSCPAAIPLMLPKPHTCHHSMPIESARLRSHKGFTLLEVLVVLAIASFLLSIAMVSYQSLIEKSQSAEASANLRMDLVFSRGEAIKRGGWVGFCGSQDGSSCQTNYQDGWLVFHDADRDSLLNNTDTVLSWTNQPHKSLAVEIEEVNQSSSGPLMFNYRGYPNRSITARTSKGEVIEEFVLQTTGRIKSR